MIASAVHRWLRALPPERRAGALREALRTPFDVLELVAIASGLIVGLLLVRAEASLLASVAWPMAIVAFFVVRRTVRALARMAADR